MSDCETPQTAAHQAPPSTGFSRQEYWSGLPFLSPLTPTLIPYKELAHPTPTPTARQWTRESCFHSLLLEQEPQESLAWISCLASYQFLLIKEAKNPGQQHVKWPHFLSQVPLTTLWLQLISHNSTHALLHSLLPIALVYGIPDVFISVLLLFFPFQNSSSTKATFEVRFVYCYIPRA